MPVVAPIKSWRQFPGRTCIRIAVQCVTDVIWVLLVNAGESQIRKPLSRVDIELTCTFSGSTHGENDEDGA
jgi:hypothetical protein